MTKREISERDGSREEKEKKRERRQGKREKKIKCRGTGSERSNIGQQKGDEGERWRERDREIGGER